MDSKEVYTRNSLSTPPNYDQMKYLYRMQARIIEKRFSQSNKRVAVKLSNSTFMLCDPEEKELISE